VESKGIFTKAGDSYHAPEKEGDGQVMEIKEMISKAKSLQTSYTLSSDEYDVVGKLITIAEQVERVEGLGYKPIKTIGYLKESILPTIEQNLKNEGFNDANSQWRALIVGVFLSVKKQEGIPLKSIHGKSFKRISTWNRGYNEAVDRLRNLFLGEKG
jgi:hypothetical protein